MCTQVPESQFDMQTVIRVTIKSWSNETEILICKMSHRIKHHFNAENVNFHACT